jgi:hypothetical protein
MDFGYFAGMAKLDERMRDKPWPLSRPPRFASSGAQTES